VSSVFPHARLSAAGIQRGLYSYIIIFKIDCLKFKGNVYCVS